MCSQLLRHHWRPLRWAQANTATRCNFSGNWTARSLVLRQTLPLGSVVSFALCSGPRGFSGPRCVRLFRRRDIGAFSRGSVTVHPGSVRVSFQVVQ